MNILGGYNYAIMDTFFSETDFGKHKGLINLLILFLIIIPLLLFNDNIPYISSSVSKIGVFTLLFIAIAVMFQCPFYMTIFLFEDGHNLDEINFYQNKKKGIIKHFQIFGILFYCFSGHSGLVQKINIREYKEEKKGIKIYKSSNILNCFIYILISIFGYLCTPIDIVNNVIERKIFWSGDIIMLISRIMLIPLSINKIQINYNITKDEFFSMFECDNQNNNNNKHSKNNDIKRNNEKLKTIVKISKIIFSITLLIVTTLISSLNQNIASKVTFLGGLCTLSAYLIPSITYVKLFGNGKCYILMGIILFLLGIFSSTLELLEFSGIEF
jgi:amino acid permease